MSSTLREQYKQTGVANVGQSALTPAPPRRSTKQPVAAHRYHMSTKARTRRDAARSAHAHRAATSTHTHTKVATRQANNSQRARNERTRCSADIHAYKRGAIGI